MEIITDSFIFEGDVFALENAGIVITYAINSANGIKRLVFARAAGAILGKRGSGANQPTSVGIFLSVGSADSGDSLRTIVTLVIVWRAHAVVGLGEAFAPQKTFIVISDSVNTADWREGIRTVLAL